jgi:hypothetical protein
MRTIRNHSGDPRHVLYWIETQANRFILVTQWRAEKPPAGAKLAVALTHSPSSRLKKKVSLCESIPQTTRRFVPAHKENKHETGRTKKFA